MGFRADQDILCSLPHAFWHYNIKSKTKCPNFIRTEDHHQITQKINYRTYLGHSVVIDILTGACFLINPIN